MAYTTPTMATVLKRQLQQLPTAPGVYQFFNAKDKLLYVGKAKSLRPRVRSYFQTGVDLSPAKQIMVAEVHHLVVTPVTNETEALLLEGNFIKQHQPPYNVVLKDDKGWLYFAIDKREPYPRVSLERRPIAKGVTYFGPYAQASTARNSLYLFKKILGLRTCTNPPEKPCFAASLGRCLGHNLESGSKTIYRAQLKRFEQLLHGQIREALATLSTEMKQAALSKQFERAARLRDQYRALERLAIKQNVIGPQPESYDVFHVAHGRSSSALVKLPVRRGVLLDPERFLVDHPKGAEEQEVLTEFLEQYYPQVTERPKQCFVPYPSSLKTVAKVRLQVPKRGKKRQLLKLAHQAAATYLDQSLASWQRRETRAKIGLKQLQEMLKLAHKPARIEGYDISNIQGREAVGAMVVLTQGLPDPKSYRKFKIQHHTEPNDFAMLAQMLTRRFSGQHDWPMPDLVMLDGGLGQLSAVQHVLTRAKVNVPLVALAKQEELLYVPGTSQPIRLPQNAPGLLLLMELRDEAHRFGITFYRSRHRKASVKSGWDELPGVGPATKRKLKAAFGTMAKLEHASVEEIAKVIGRGRTESIRTHLHITG